MTRIYDTGILFLLPLCPFLSGSFKIERLIIYHTKCLTEIEQKLSFLNEIILSYN